MENLSFHIRLTTDAEPGTGLGGEVVNELVPRDHQRRPILPASHIKGLMRAALRDIAGGLGWTDEIEAAVFGSPDESRPGVEAAMRLSDAVAVGTTRTNLVTRTAVEESGVARDQTLRTTESVPVGTEFTGRIQTNIHPGTVKDLAWRLALLAIPAVGGNRNRGSGRCIVTLDGEGRSPGEILRELAAALQQPAKDFGAASFQSPEEPLRDRRNLSSESVVLRLVFQAATPICCPEIPDKTNVISTGFSIPASAVQGMVLNRIAREQPAIAEALFGCASFRAWPLQPCSLAFGLDESNELPIPIRVSLTHRAAKFSTPDGIQPHHFFDEALDNEPYDWTTVADGAPLKASDGVLLCWPSGEVQLWKATAMPHVITAHGVHSDPQNDNGRNLFTVDAMAPMVWQGLLVMPRDAAEMFRASLDRTPHVAFGKSRSVRGSGTLHATVIEGVPDEWRTRTEQTVLVVQSPLLLGDRPEAGQTAEQEFEQLVRQWAERHGLPVPAKRPWANVGVQFGWNRHRSGLQQACRVVLPGSVIACGGRLDDARLAAVLTSNGLGGGRDRGFGAVSVHPGKAVKLFEPSPHVRTLADDSNGRLHDATRLVLEIRNTARRLPSPSQICAVQQRLLKAGREGTLTYLKQQTERTSRIWFIWEAIHSQMHKLLSDFDEKTAVRALETLADLAILDQKKGDRE
jgi:CRISPR/Cas system CSM-associated protein Csm3 (group 7 of RAMP superfamily)